MEKYRATYKCLLCGKVQQLEEFSVDRDQLPVMLAKVVQNQMFRGNPYLYKAPYEIPCKCSDGSCGLAQFAGFKRV